MPLSYPTDISDAQWELLLPLLPAAKTGGRPRSVDLRAIINAIFYIVVAGGAWRMLPHDFPQWQTVYHYFRTWRLDGTWEKIHTQCVQWERTLQGHEAVPSAASLDSQSVKIGLPTPISIGFDGGKKTKGRKRHLMVDTLGLVIMVVVTAAHISDQAGARLLFHRLAVVPERIARLVRIWVDGTYEGVDFMRWTMDTYRWILETIKRSEAAKGFVLLPKRWVVERTWGWLNWSRRLSKDYEVLPETSEAFIYVAMIRLMLRRLA
jgi:putative transposase